MSVVHDDDCTTPDHVDCAIDDSRRAFLRHGLLAVAALTAVAGAAIPLEAMTRTYVSGRREGDALRYPVPATDGATIDGPNKVIVVRYQGFASAFSLECPHRGTALEWQPENTRFFCPKHKSTFKPEGTLTGGKAERNMDRHAITLDGTALVVDKAVVIKSSADAAAWAAATVKLA